MYYFHCGNAEGGKIDGAAFKAALAVPTPGAGFDKLTDGSFCPEIPVPLDIILSGEMPGCKTADAVEAESRFPDGGGGQITST